MSLGAVNIADVGQTRKLGVVVVVIVVVVVTIVVVVVIDSRMLERGVSLPSRDRNIHSGDNLAINEKQTLTILQLKKRFDLEQK